jgi:preprotein translocase subunit SecA
LAQAPTVEGERPVKTMVMQTIEREIEQIVLFHTADDSTENWNLEEMENAFTSLLPAKVDVRSTLKSLMSTDGHDIATRRTAVIEGMMKVAKQAYAAIEQAVGDSVRMGEIEKNVLIQATDMLWVEHLEAIDHLRRGIGLRSYGQRDPLVEYKKEAFKLYSELNVLIQKQVVYAIYKFGGVTQALADNVQAPLQYSAPAKEMSAGNDEFGATGSSIVMPLDQAKAKDKNEEDEIIGQGRITSLKRDQENVSKVAV